MLSPDNQQLIVDSWCFTAEQIRQHALEAIHELKEFYKQQAKLI